MKTYGELHYLWRAMVQDGEVLEAYVSKRQGRKTAFKLLKTTMKRYSKPNVVVSDRLKSYRAIMQEIGSAATQNTGEAQKSN